MTQSNSQLAPERPQAKPDASARRTRLREFQVQLVERMQAARKGGHVQANQLGVMIGQGRWLLNLREAGEILSLGPVMQVPLTQDWFLGLTSVRGNLMSVIDFARFLGDAPTVTDKDARVIAFASSLSFNCGLLVSRVMGLRNVSDMEPYTEAVPNAPAWAVRHYRDRDGQIWSELNLSLIVQDPAFLHVGL